MFQIIGIVVVLGMVFGGFLLAGGHFDVIIKAAPFEMMMIGGAAVGALLIGNSFKTVLGVGGGIMKAMAGPKWKAKDYTDLLSILFVLTKTMKTKGVVAIEAHIENPKESRIFQEYPKIMKDHFALDLICDTLRMMSASAQNTAGHVDVFPAGFLGIDQSLGDRLFNTHARQFDQHRQIDASEHIDAAAIHDRDGEIGWRAAEHVGEDDHALAAIGPADSLDDIGAALFHVVFRADRDCLEGFLRADNVLHGIAEFVGEAPMCDQYQSDHVHPSLLERSITIRLPHAVSLPDQADKRLIFRLNRHDF